MSNYGVCTVCKKPITVTVFRGSPYCSNQCKKIHEIAQLPLEELMEKSKPVAVNSESLENQALISAKLPFTWINGYATMADLTISADNSLTIRTTPHPDMIDEFRDLLLKNFSLGVFIAGIAAKYMEEKPNGSKK